MELLKPGQLFAGRYHVVRRLAEGGMGAVYVAVQQATELEVALKVLWPHVLQRAEAAGRFALEAKLAARIRSDHIVQVFDAGFDETTQMPFLVMELLKGATLQRLVEERGPLPAAEVLELLTQTARGLDRAHTYKDAAGASAPVIHRDLKPDNLFVARRETGEPLVKILDYGIAKVLSQSTSLSREIKGTPIYMAYEQAVGKGLSPQTDIWALGLITYFALTGHSYWRSTRSQESDLNTLLTEIVALPIEPPTQRLAESGGATARTQPQGTPVVLTTEFDEWFQRCVHRDPAQRFASAGEAVNALARALSLPSRATTTGSSLPFEMTVLPQDVARSLPTGPSQTGPSQPAGAQTGGAQTGAATPSESAVGATMNPASVTQGGGAAQPRWPWVAALAGLALVGVFAFLVLSEEKTQGAAAPAPLAPAPPVVSVPAAPEASKPVLEEARPEAQLAAQAPSAAEPPQHKPSPTTNSAAPSSSKPVAPAKSATSTTKALKPAAPKSTKPAVAAPSASVPSAPTPAKPKFDPLAGPRVH